MSQDRCEGCDRRAILTPLHGPEKGGPLRCYVCAGAWNAEHGRKRRMGRVVIRAIKAFLDGGGSERDVQKLKDTALMGMFFGFGNAIADPLGYMADTATTADETVLLTSELLTEVLRLTHPDAHPPERRELANRVTQQLLALQPFVFPAVKPKRVAPYTPGPRHASEKGAGGSLKEPLARYPCAECASAVPMDYCTACRTEWDKRQLVEHERERAKHREWYALRKARRKYVKWRAPCAACGKDLRGRRKDARYCSEACRQRGHRTRSKATEKAP
jgi:hypothetical protein